MSENINTPWTINTHDLKRTPGASRQIHSDIPISETISTPMIGVSAGETLSVELRLESVVEGVLVTGQVHAPIHGECGRCLRAVNDRMSVELCELYAYPDSTTEETSDPDDVMHLDGELIHLEQAVRDAVVLALPGTPVCSEECQGLCAECGEPWRDLPPDHAHHRSDPRWSALARWQNNNAVSDSGESRS